MQRYTRGLSFTSSRASSGTREFANRTRKIATPPSELVASFLHVRYPFDRNLVVKWGTRKGEERREYKIGREKGCQIFRINKNARFRGGKHSFSWPCKRLRAGLALVQTSSLSLFARNRGNFCLINDIGFGIFPLPSIVEVSLHPSRDPFRPNILVGKIRLYFFFFFFLACHFSSLIEEECFPRQSMHRGVMFTGPTRNYHVLGSI